MSSPIDLVLARLDGFKLRQHGRDRWRACCPAHNGSNPSALSVGVGAEDQVLLRCWQGCEVEEIVYSLGLELSNLFPPKPQHHSSGKPARRRLISAGQALDLLDAEMTLAVVCAADLAAGRPLDEPTRERLLKSAARVSMLREEAHA